MHTALFVAHSNSYIPLHYLTTMDCECRRQLFASSQPQNQLSRGPTH